MQYISRDNKNMMMSGGFDVDAYHDPNPENPAISELILMLMGAIDVPEHVSDATPIVLKEDDDQ